MTFVTTVADDPSVQTGTPAQQPTVQDQAPQSTGTGMTEQQLSELVKRDAHAQQHIANLEEENRGMREDLSKLMDQMQSFETKLSAQQTVEQLLKGTSTSTPAQQPQEPATMQTPAFDQSQVEEMVTQRVQKIFTEREQEQNYMRAAQRLTETFKDKADEHVAKVASENGLSYEDAQGLAKTNPVLFENLFINQAVKTTTPAAPTQGNQSTGTVQTQNTLDQAYWTKMRREQPNRFWSPEVQKQYHSWFHSNKG